jgi:hypothetical protein
MSVNAVIHIVSTIRVGWCSSPPRASGMTRETVLDPWIPRRPTGDPVTGTGGA